MSDSKTNRIVIPLTKKFGNGEYIWQSEKAFGVWVEDREEPIFLPKNTVGAPIKETETTWEFWVSDHWMMQKDLEEFVCTDHLPFLF